MEDQKTCYHAVNELGEQSRSDYLAVVPLLTSANTLQSLLVIEAMPFLSLTQENLQVLAALCGYYADDRQAIEKTEPLLAVYPRCSLHFAAELYRLTTLHERYGILVA